MPNGIVTLLDAEHDAAVHALWAEFRAKLSLQGVAMTPYPHFSYHVADSYDIPKLRQCVADFAAKTAPFTVQTTGLGIFTGARPVVYIPLVSSAALLEFQAGIWDLCETSVQLNSYAYYKPDNWVPHITIAQGDIQPQHIPEVMRLLSERNFAWQIRVENLAFLVDGGAGNAHQIEEIYHLEG